jgi:hypothetical protein
MIKTFRIVLAVLAFGAFAGAAWGKSILFVGNSFIYGEYSALKHYRPDTVTDLNKTGIGGVPALFKAFAEESGLDYQVSLETVGGKGLDYHFSEKLPLLDRRWDVVLLQSYSTLDAGRPGDPRLLSETVKRFSDTLHRRNAAVKIYLDATWSRADLTYPEGTPWHGKPIEQMGRDIDSAYRLAARSSSGISGVIPVGLAWNRAIGSGIADPNPYDGIAAKKIDLWAFDHYHASAYGYYLEALTIFGRVTGLDPLILGGREKSIDDLGLDPKIIAALEQIAHDQLAED